MALRSSSKAGWRRTNGGVWWSTNDHHVEIPLPGQLASMRCRNNISSELALPHHLLPLGIARLSSRSSSLFFVPP